MATAHIAHSAVLLDDGRVLVIAGGKPDGLSSTAVSEIYDPANNRWTLAAPLPASVHRHAATLLRNGNVLVSGGSDDCCRPNNFVHLYQPSTNTWRSLAPMLMQRLDHTLSLLPNDTILIAGGGTAATEIYNPSAGTNGQSELAAPGPSARAHTATPLANGDVVIAGGYSGFTFFIILSAPSQHLKIFCNLHTHKSLQCADNRRH